MTNVNDTTITPQACRVISECRLLINRTRAVWGEEVARESAEWLGASLGAIFGIAQSGATIVATDTYGLGVQVNETGFYAEMVATPMSTETIRRLGGPLLGVAGLDELTDTQVDEYGRPHVWSVHS